MHHDADVVLKLWRQMVVAALMSNNLKVNTH
jgi:hypothetical protein